MPTFTFYYLQKQPYKYADIKILRTVNVDLTVCLWHSVGWNMVGELESKACIF